MRALFFSALLIRCVAFGQVSPRDDTSALRFARAFYAWYVPAQARAHERGVEVVLKGRPEALVEDARVIEAYLGGIPPCLT